MPPRRSAVASPRLVATTSSSEPAATGWSGAGDQRTASPLDHGEHPQAPEGCRARGPLLVGDRRTVRRRACLDRDARHDQDAALPDRDRREDLATDRRRRERRRGQGRDAARVVVAERSVQPRGQVRVEEPQHDAQVRPQRARVERGGQVGRVVVGAADDRARLLDVERLEHVPAAHVRGQHRDAQLARRLDERPVRGPFRGHHRDAALVQQ